MGREATWANSLPTGVSPSSVGNSPLSSLARTIQSAFRPRGRHVCLEIALENVSIAIGDANDLGFRASLGHHAGLAVSLQPTKTLFLLNGLLATFGVLFFR